MVPDIGRHEVATKRVRFDVAGTRDVVIRTGVPYAAGDAEVHTLDVYEPPRSAPGVGRPAVLFVTGLSDVGARSVLGCRINEMESYRCWGRLVAASGLVGVTYTTGLDPATDTREVVASLREHGAALGIDASRLGLWACSSHVPNALGLLMEQPGSFRCAALCYGFMLDVDGASDVADASRTWRFANPAAGRPLSDLPADLPLFIARAGRDANPGINASIDRLVRHGLRSNLHLVLANHPLGPHAFDLDDDSQATRAIVGAILGFLRAHLEGVRGATG